MQSGDQQLGYACVLLGAAPLASQLAMASIRWAVFFPLFAVPALSLLVAVGHLSATGPVLTFRRIAPIASGIGWAFSWHVAERLYVEALRAAQIFLYIIFSLRPSLSWAVSCDHGYNSQYCVNFDETNVSMVTEYHHYPDNYWPAQEFNRYLVRNNPTPEKMLDVWEPNEWYLGPSKEAFYFALPSLPLLMGHSVVWSFIFIVLVKYPDRLGDILTRVCIALPLALYLAVAMGMTVVGFHFGSSIQVDIDDKKINDDPYDFWADVRGGFRTSLLIVDYSSAFTGLILFATSRLRAGAGQLNALYLVPLMMVVPAIQTIIRSGCEGHIADIQPAYKLYASTDETISFDLMPVCFATSTLGPVWSLLYFTAQFLYTSLGPMLVYTAFIYQSFVDDIPTVQNVSKLFFSALAVCFAAPSMLLYMPLGTKVAALFRYTSQAPLVQIFAYVVLFFVYGWQRIEQDVLTTSNSAATPSLSEYLTRPTSPVYTTALFTIVPMLLCAKFVAVFDLLTSGNDIVKHIDAGVEFIPAPIWLARLFGYGFMFAPIIIVTAMASYTMFDMVVRHKLPASEAFRPTSEWMSHHNVAITRPKPHSLAYGLFNSIFHVPYPTLLFVLFIFETFIGFTLVALFFLNSLSLIGINTSNVANDYRSCMLLTFVALHIVTLYEMRRSQQNDDDPARLSLYIGVATLETAMLNGYMWMFAADHNWGLDMIPFLLIVCITWVRGCCITAAIAVRANMIELARPSRAREASEVYDGDAVIEMDPEDDSPVIFDLAHA